MANLLPITALQTINLQAQDVWNNSQQDFENNQVDAVSIRKQIAEQNGLGAALMRYLGNPNKDEAVRIFWQDFCNMSASDCDSDDYCGDLSAAATGVSYKDYAITQCIYDRFSVSESTFAGSFQDMASFIAAKQVNTMKNLLQRANTKYLLALHANAGFNRGTTYTANATTGVTEIPTANFANSNVMTDIMLDAMLSRVQNPFILDGSNLWRTLENARQNAGNDTGKGDAVRAGLYDVTPDPFGFANAGTAVQDSTFLVTPYAMAFVSKNYYNETVPTYDNTLGKEKWSIPVPGFGLRLDVLHQRFCESGKKDRYSHVWNYTLNYDFLTNPYGCADANGKIVTGIIEYKKVA